jgi:formylglycine-generating enzyme required for sulfatase activity
MNDWRGAVGILAMLAGTCCLVGCSDDPPSADPSEVHADQVAHNDTAAADPGKSDTAAADPSKKDAEAKTPSGDAATASPDATAASGDASAVSSSGSSASPLPASLAPVKPAGDQPAVVPVKPQTEKPFVLELSPGVSMQFVWIPPGEFIMGDGSNELPSHDETIEPFYLGAYEVTQEQWTTVMGSNPSLTRGAKYPVERLNWSDCQAFVSKMNEKYADSGMKFGLPTEAQWEYACRAGRPILSNPTDSREEIEEYAWMGRNAHSDTHPVGQKKPNDWGLYDMQGNVAEFCAEVVQGPTADGEEWHVVRGGNIRSGYSECRSVSRVPRRPVVPLRQDGVRLMCVPVK